MTNPEKYEAYGKWFLAVGSLMVEYATEMQSPEGMTIALRDELEKLLRYVQPNETHILGTKRVLMIFEVVSDETI